MKLTGGQIVVRALEDEGIERTFGIPGTHNIELYDALGAADGVRPVLVTDEQSASFMADGHWRASGRMACVNIVPGAGLTHAMSGIAEAFLDNVPMLVLGCGIRRDTAARYQLHDVDQQALAGAVCKATYLPTEGEALYATIREACRVARAGVPGPVFVEVPANLYMFKHEVPDLAREETGSAGSVPGAVAPGNGAPEAVLENPPAPEGAVVDEVARRLLEGDRVLLYVGAGCAGAHGQLRRLAEILESPVSTTFQGKGVFPETHPLFLWPGFGASAPPFARKVARACDVTLAVGCRFSEVGTGSYGMEPPGSLIHVDIDPRVPGSNYPADVAVHSDSGAFLDALLERLSGREPAPDESLRNRIRKGHQEAHRELLEGKGGEGVTPAHLLRILQDRLGPEAIFTTDSGNGTFVAMECLRLEGPGRFLAPVDYSCMGYSVPAALGAKLARPHAPVVALAGDGAFLMTGLEVLTAAQEAIGVVVVVLRDRELAQIAQFQDTALSRKVASEVHDYELERLAAGVGVDFLRVERDADVEGAVAEAAAVAAEGRPVLVEVAIDYSRRTWFTRGVVKTNLLRLPLKDRLRMVGRAVVRKVTG